MNSAVSEGVSSPCEDQNILRSIWHCWHRALLKLPTNNQLTFARQQTWKPRAMQSHKET